MLTLSRLTEFLLDGMNRMNKIKPLDIRRVESRKSY